MRSDLTGKSSSFLRRVRTTDTTWNSWHFVIRSFVNTVKCFSPPHLQLWQTVPRDDTPSSKHFCIATNLPTAHSTWKIAMHNSWFFSILPGFQPNTSTCFPVKYSFSDGRSISWNWPKQTKIVRLQPENTKSLYRNCFW